MAHEAARVRNIVLVHGGFVDGSGWERVYRILKKDEAKASHAIYVSQPQAVASLIEMAAEGGDSSRR